MCKVSGKVFGAFTLLTVAGITHHARYINKLFNRNRMCRCATTKTSAFAIIERRESDDLSLSLQCETTIWMDFLAIVASIPLLQNRDRAKPSVKIIVLSVRQPLSVPPSYTSVGTETRAKKLDAKLHPTGGTDFH